MGLRLYGMEGVTICPWAEQRLRSQRGALHHLLPQRKTALLLQEKSGRRHDGDVSAPAGGRRCSERSVRLV